MERDIVEQLHIHATTATILGEEPFAQIMLDAAQEIETLREQTIDEIVIHTNSGPVIIDGYEATNIIQLAVENYINEAIRRAIAHYELNETASHDDQQT